jgi:DNA-nicking Smr family endonuclease
LKLKYNLPFADEMEIKWVYYQYLDYQKTFSHFCKISGSNKNKLSKIIEDSSNPLKKNYDKNKNNKDKILLENYNNNNKNIKIKQKSEISNNEEQTNLTNILYKIMNDNPENWKIDINGKVNLSDYQNIRRKLLTQAQLSWRSGRHQDAKIIMAKSRRYKDEINFLLKNKKIEVFVKNNENNLLTNMISKKENFLDLHGLNYAEAEMITKKKLKDILERKNYGGLDENKTFTLTVVTGKGNHSQGKKAVLLPKLAEFLSKTSFDHKVEWTNGIIKIFV